MGDSESETSEQENEFDRRCSLENTDMLDWAAASVAGPEEEPQVRDRRVCNFLTSRLEDWLGRFEQQIESKVMNMIDDCVRDVVDQRIASAMGPLFSLVQELREDVCSDTQLSAKPATAASDKPTEAPGISHPPTCPARSAPVSAPAITEETTALALLAETLTAPKSESGEASHVLTSLRRESMRSEQMELGVLQQVAEIRRTQTRIKEAEALSLKVFERSVSKIQQAVRQKTKLRTRKADVMKWQMRKKYPSYVTAFEQAEQADKDGCFILSDQLFEDALISLFPWLSSAQSRAIWMGYLEGTGSRGVSVGAFCSIAEAVANGVEDAAEFADMPAVQFALLGKKPDNVSPHASDSEAKIWTEGQGSAYLTSIFNEAVLSDGGCRALGAPAFSSALQKVSGYTTPAQIDALWRGYTAGTGSDGIDFDAFCVLVEAVAEGEEEAAEFADMPAAQFARLGKVC